MNNLSFDHPDVRKVIETVFSDLIFESDRGAVLIAGELVSDNLERLFCDFFPCDFKAKNFLNYPGPLSSAAARSDAAYAFRLIGKNLYRTITILRQIRNDAAHSPASFRLEAHADRLREAYEATVTPGDAINSYARQLMTYRLAEVLRSVDSEVDPSSRAYSEEEVDEILDRPEISQHLPKYQLAVAASVICALIVYHRSRLLAGIEESTRMAEFRQPQKPSSEEGARNLGEASRNPAE